MNSSLLYSICGLIVILSVYKQRRCWYFIWQLNGWRGLVQQPILWLLLIVYLEPKSIMSSIQRCHKYFQFPLAIIVFNRILLYVDDPETMETILTAPECLNKTFLQNGFYANKGLLHAMDEQWKIRRKQLNPAFSHNTLVSFFEVFNRVANELKHKISEDLLGFKMNFKCLEDLITRAVLQVSCLTTMGYETNFLQHDGKSIAQTYRYLMELTALRILKPWYQVDFIFRLLDKKNYEKSKKANKMVEEFVDNIVEQKHIEWQNKYRLNQKPDDIRNTTSDCATETRRANVGLLLNENTENHNFTGETTAATNDVFKNIVEEIFLLHDTNAKPHSNTVKLEQQPQRHPHPHPHPHRHQQQQQQQNRIFIDQMFYLAQNGKLTLQDIINESQSMVVVSFETVSTCIINALLCLAINQECQIKLRHEIKQVLLMSKNKIKNKTRKITTKSTASMTRNNDPTTKNTTNCNESCVNTTDDEFDFATTSHEDYEGDVNKNSASSKSNSSKSNDETETPAADDEIVTMEDLLNMPYLDMIINESLRLLTTVPMNLRHVSADFQLNVKQRDRCTRNMKNHENQKNFKCSCCCVVVPKDTIIALDTFNMQRNKLIWGRNAWKFFPEHFNKKVQHRKGIKDERECKEEIETSETSTTAASTFRHSYSFIPFSKGLRTCIGHRYSIYLSKIVLIKLISSFEFSTNIHLPDLQYYEGVSLKFRNAEKINFQIHPVG